MCGGLICFYSRYSCKDVFQIIQPLVTPSSVPQGFSCIYRTVLSPAVTSAAGKLTLTGQIHGTWWTKEKEWTFSFLNATMSRLWLPVRMPRCLVSDSDDHRRRVRPEASSHFSGKESSLNDSQLSLSRCNPSWVCWWHALACECCWI